MVPRTDLSSEPWNPGAAPGLGPQCQASTLRHSMFPGEGGEWQQAGLPLQDDRSRQQA